MNLGELKAQVEDVLGRSDIPLACYTLMMDDAVKRLRLHGLELAVTLSSPYTLPSDFLSAVSVKINDIALTTTEVFPDWVGSGSPTMFRVSGSVLQFWPANTGPVALRYDTAPAALSNSGDSNAILDRFPAVALYGSLWQYSRLTRDEAAGAAYGPAYEEAIAAAIRHEALHSYSGGQIAIQPRASP
jgi:hypothetical protein